MEKNDKIIITLLARIAGHLEGLPADEILAAVVDATAPKEMVPKDTVLTKRDEVPTDMEAVERIFELYPTKCPVSGRTLGKCARNKRQIIGLLRSRTAKDIEMTIREYVVDCKNHGVFLKDFSTLLNQFPEREEPKNPAPAQKQPQKRSPELMALEAMHQGVTDANVVKQGILMAWGDTISQATLNGALRNAGYIL